MRKSAAKQREERLRTAASLDHRKQSSLDKRDALKTLSRNKNVTILEKVSGKVAGSSTGPINKNKNGGSGAGTKDKRGLRILKK